MYGAELKEAQLAIGLHASLMGVQDCSWLLDNYDVRKTVGL